MGKIFKYAFLTGFIAYLLAAVAMFLLSLSQSGWSHVDGDNARFMINMVTVGLNDYPWWGHFWYLAVLVPLLGSSLVLALFLMWRGIGRRRAMWAGLSVALYYVFVLLVFAIGKLVANWGNIDVHPGDFVYALLIIWPVGGLVLGYVSATITDKIVGLPAAD